MEKERTELGTAVKQYDEAAESNETYYSFKYSFNLAPKKPRKEQNTPTNENYQSFKKSIKVLPKKNKSNPYSSIHSSISKKKT